METKDCAHSSLWSTVCAEEANGLKFPPGNSSFQGDWYPPHLPQLALIPIYSFPLTAFSVRGNQQGKPAGLVESKIWGENSKYLLLSRPILASYLLLHHQTEVAATHYHISTSCSTKGATKQLHTGVTYQFTYK